MAFTSKNGPKGGAAAVGAELGHLLARGPGAVAPQGGAEAFNTGKVAPKMSQPIALYTVALPDIRDAGFLVSARDIGWRYVIFANGPSAVADVDEVGGQSQFKRLTRGPIVPRLVEAISVAEATFADAQDEYELRILEIPALYVVAVWIHGTNDAFLPVAEGAPSLPVKIGVDPAFIDHILKLAHDKGQTGLRSGATP